MNYIDPHIHMVSRVTDDYKRMSLAGCVLVSEPAFWAGFDRSGVEGFRDYFRQLTEYEGKRAAAYGIEHCTWLCINAKEAENVSLSREVIAMIPEFLHRPGVLGIGEIGLNKNTKNEATVFLDHLDLAARTQELILVHTPHLADKYQGTRMILDMLRDDSRIHPERVCIDHVEEHTIREALECRPLGGDDSLPDHQMHAGPRGRFDRDLWNGANHGQLGRRLGTQRPAGRARADLRDAPARTCRFAHSQGRLRESADILRSVCPLRFRRQRSDRNGGGCLRERGRRQARCGGVVCAAMSRRRDGRGGR